MATVEFVAPSWLSDQDAETIQKRMMDSLPADIDETEAGFPWDFTMPTALEKAEMLEFHLVETLKIMFPMWAYDSWLDLHAKGDGIERKGANSAYGVLSITGTSGTEIPAGFRFAVPSAGGNPAVEFTSIETAYIGEDGTATVGVVATEAGTVGNVSAGAITIMAEPIKGITSITNPEKTSGGTEEEADDSLRERIDEIDKSDEASFVGSDADYIRWAKEVIGVGDVFVIANWDESVSNSVKVVVLDANGEPANEHIVEEVYNHIISPDNRIERKAPVGAILTVSAPTIKSIAYAFKATLRSGYTAAAVVSAIATSFQNYYTGAKLDNLVKYNEIHALITESPGIYDFTELTLNGSTANIALGQDEYPATASIDAGLPAEEGAG